MKTISESAVARIQPKFPADMRGLWDFGNYSATPRPVVRNEYAADQAISKDITRYTRIKSSLFSKFGTPVATMTDNADDVSARVTWAAGTGSVAWQAGITVPSGVYTIVYTMAPVTGTQSVQLRNAFAGSTSNVSVSGGYARYVFTTGTVTTVNPQLLNVSGAAADIYLQSIEVYPGAVDPGAGGKFDHLFLGTDAYHAQPTVDTTLGIVNLTGTTVTCTGTIQYATPFSRTNFTVMMLVKKIAAGAYNTLAVPLSLVNFDAIFTPDYAGDTGFQIVSGVDVVVGHTSRASTTLQPFQNVPFDRYGKEYMVITMRYDLANLKASVFVDDVQIGGQISCPAAAAATVRDMLLNSQQSTESMAILATIDRPMTDAEIRSGVALMRRRAARRKLPLDMTRRILVMEGASQEDGLVLTAGGLGPWPYLYKPNATVPYHGVVYATGGGNLATIEARKDLVKATWNSTPGRVFDFCVGIVAGNDAPNIGAQDAVTYAARYAAYLDYVTGGPKNDGSGTFVNCRKVIVATCPNRLDGGAVAQPAAWVWIQAVNAIIRTWVGTHCTHVVDIGADPYLGQQNSPLDTNNFMADKAHFTQGAYGSPYTGQALVESLWRVPLNA